MSAFVSRQSETGERWQSRGLMPEGDVILWPRLKGRPESASANWFLARSDAWEKSPHPGPLPAGEGARVYSRSSLCRANAKS